MIASRFHQLKTYLIVVENIGYYIHFIKEKKQEIREKKQEIREKKQEIREKKQEKREKSEKTRL